MIKLINTPFEWSKHDCCIAAADYYARHFNFTGPLEEFKGKYNTKYEAYRLLIKSGGMEGILKKYGFTEHPPLRARDNDIALYYIPKQGLAMGIVQNGKAYFAGGAMVSIREINKIFRKGDL